MKTYLKKFILKGTVLIFIGMGTLNLAAQSGLPETPITLVEDSSNIDLYFSKGASKGLLNVEINNRNTGASCANSQVILYNQLGEQVYQMDIYGFNISMDLRALAPGVYDAQFTFGNKVLRKKINLE
jgi:hypothetical protein